MKKYPTKAAIVFLLTLGLTTFLYWPLYQKVKIGNSKSNIDSVVSRIDLPLGVEIKEMLDRKIDLPPTRHRLCLKNNNGFHFIHADSNSPGVPFYFYTDDLNKSEYGKTNKLGSMAIRLYYKDGLHSDELYREYNAPPDCIQLDTRKLEKYASSTIEYSYAGLNRLENLDLGDKGKMILMRALVGGYFIDVSESSVYIVMIWEYFIGTFLVLFAFFFWLVGLAIKYLHRFFPNLTKKQND